jgi:Leucine-rich repeat (LRR) protein
MEPEDAAANAGTLPEYHMSWWEPDLGNGRSALHVDRSIGRIQMVHDNGILYVGLDVDDAAVSGVSGEAGRDGLRITMRHIGELDNELTLSSRQFDFWVDSTASIAYGLDAALIRNALPEAIEADVALKGATTVADPSDVDEGYQIEIAIDLAQVLGYTNGVGKTQYADNRIWIALNFFDGDFLESLSDSYATRTWILGERGNGASLYGWLSSEPLIQPSDLCASQMQIPVSECNALEALYDSTNGDGWNDKTGWKTSSLPCAWYGVGCAGGHVNYLALGENNLDGVMPSELEALGRMNTIDFHSNNLVGAIPPELGHYPNLGILNLSHNKLEGAVPPALAQLENLHTLYLHYNSLSGSIPPELAQLSELVNLYLEHNSLSGSIPAELGQLVNLHSLFLNNNLLTGPMPLELADLVELRSLTLYSNNLTGSVPPELGQLSNLTSLSASHNHLTGQIPPELGELAGLVYLNLFDNDLAGPIPAELGRLGALGYLSLSHNNLSGQIPPELGQLTSLTHLYLGYNSLHGPIPPELGLLTNLEVLWLGPNQLSNTVPLPVAVIGKPLGGNCIFTSNHPSLCFPDIAPYQEVGNPICGLPLDPSCVPVVHVSAKVFLEGAYAGSDSLATSQNFASGVPLSQPYQQPVFDDTPLDHDVPASVTDFPPSTVDWVLASLRTGTSAATELSSSTRAALLLSDGSVVDTNGTTLAFHGVEPGPYWLVVRHRNHASVMSLDTLDLSNGFGSWDFTTAMAQAYTTGPVPMKDLGDSRFAMYAADANVDGLITVSDFNAWLLDTKAVATGYRQTDFNLDGQVTAADFNLWLVNTKAIASTQVPE